MKRYLMQVGAVILPFLVVGFLHAAHGAEWPVDAMNAQIDQTNFLVNDNCSATLIDAQQGYLLTANHCIKDQFVVIEREKIDDDGVVKKEKVRIAKPGTVSQLYFKATDEVQRNSYVFKIKLNDANLDLALIQVQTKLTNADSAPVSCDDPVRGETSYAVGNPFGVLYATVTKGIIASIRRNYRMIGVDTQGENGLVQSTAPIEGGNSGGGLFNGNGEIIGVNVRGSAVNETVALAVPLSDIKKFLTREGLNSLWSRCP